MKISKETFKKEFTEFLNEEGVFNELIFNRLFAIANSEAIQMAGMMRQLSNEEIKKEIVEDGIKQFCDGHTQEEVVETVTKEHVSVDELLEGIYDGIDESSEGTVEKAVLSAIFPPFTLEGVDFWEEISNKWAKRCEKFDK